jgi:L-seryl-tRNA(Ser) seleniumtransferase
LVRKELDDIREAINSGRTVPTFEEIISSVVARASYLGEPSLQPVINATGVILHTNLGRAPLGLEAIEAMRRISPGYSNLEFDLDSGKRGSRQVHVERQLCQFTGAPAAIVVNNNAAAVLLALSTLARRKEVIVSRGQGVQIGGGFRIPEVMRQSGARLVEVGTTNCTYLSDYEQAITSRTAALLRVHSSNFKITGFTHSVPLEEMVNLGSRYGLPVLDDIGSGALIDTTEYGLDAEPRVQDSLTAGVALVCFSGDKLLGGPQAGIILGKSEFIDKLRKHPLARAVRIDKLRLAALATTLSYYLRGVTSEKIPVLRFMAVPLSELEKRAEKWARVLGPSANTAAGDSTVGGGSLPGSTLPTRRLIVRFRKEVKIQEVTQRLRQHQPPIICLVANNCIMLDPRCVFPDEDEVVINTLQELITTFGDPHA